MADRAAQLEVFVGDSRRLLSPGGRPFVVGRDDDVDLQILDGLVSRRHLALSLGPDGWVVQDTSRNGSFVDGRRVDRFVVTAPTVVRLGAATDAPELRVRRHAGVAPDDRTAADRVSEQGRLSTVRTVHVESLRIGRAPDNDMVLDDLLVSRHHAVLARDPSGWRITDLSSANGTFVDGSRITTAVLGPDDVVGIGHSLLRARG